MYRGKQLPSYDGTEVQEQEVYYTCPDVEGYSGTEYMFREVHGDRFRGT